MFQGRCLCGAVRFEVDGPFVVMVNCHCSMCRKHHGSAFVTWVAAPGSGFRVTAGQGAIASFASSEKHHRSFCTTCGSVMPELDPAGNLAIIPAGSLLGPLGMTPRFHMFVASKAPWYTITDALPQHAEAPPELGLPAVERPAPVRPASLVHGSCLCGSVTYEIDRLASRLMYCHCSRCRLARGAAFATNAFFGVEEFRWSRGDELVTQYALPGARVFGVAFCRRCGSDVPRVARARNVVSVPAGTLDSDPGTAPTAHIYLDSRADWDDLPNDGVAQFAAMPP